MVLKNAKTLENSAKCSGVPLMGENDQRQIDKTTRILLFSHQDKVKTRLIETTENKCKLNKILAMWRCLNFNNPIPICILNLHL